MQELFFDKISFTCQLRNYKEDINLIKEELFDYLGIPHSVGYAWHYEANIKQQQGEGNAKLQVGGLWENTKNIMRLEFNPSKMSWQLTSALKILRKYIKVNQKLGVGFKVTRLDWAIDLPVHLETLTYNCRQGIKRRKYWTEGGEEESQYFGARGSEKMIRVYDKAKEQGEQEIRTRVESECRKEFDLYKPLVFYNPFKDFEVWQKNGIEGAFDGSIEELALLEYLQRNPQDFKKLTVYKKRKVKELRKRYFKRNYKKIDLEAIVKRDYQKCISELQRVCGVVV